MVTAYIPTLYTDNYIHTDNQCTVKGWSLTDIVFVRVVSLLEGEDRGMEDATILFQGVGLWGEGENGLVIGW